MTKLYNKQIQKPLRRSLCKSMPKGEVILWKKLKNKQLGYKFRRQYGIDKYVIDFYCPKLNLAIEVDGLTHDDRDKIMCDKNRQKYIESLGIRIKRFSSQEIFEDIESIINQIYHICQKSDKTSPYSPPW